MKNGCVKTPTAPHKMPPNSFDLTDPYSSPALCPAPTPCAKLMHEAFSWMVDFGGKDLCDAVINGNTTVSFGELHQLSDQLATEIIACSADSAPVAICLRGTARSLTCPLHA